MLGILEKAYQPMIGRVDVEHGTLPELEKVFKDAGAPPGQMVTKALRFYIKALEDCGVKVSEHITKPRPPGPKKPKAAKPKKPKDSGTHTDGENGSRKKGARMRFRQVSSALRSPDWLMRSFSIRPTSRKTIARCLMRWLSSSAHT